MNDQTKKIIRQCWGLAIDDISRDDEMEQISPRRAFGYLCQWHFGDNRWAMDIIDWMEGCGLEIKNKPV